MVLPSTPDPSMTPSLGCFVCCRATARRSQLLYLLWVSVLGSTGVSMPHRLAHGRSVSDKQVADSNIDNSNMENKMGGASSHLSAKDPLVPQGDSVDMAIVCVQWLLTEVPHPPPSVSAVSSGERAAAPSDTTRGWCFLCFQTQTHWPLGGHQSPPPLVVSKGQRVTPLGRGHWPSPRFTETPGGRVMNSRLGSCILCCVTLAGSLSLSEPILHMATMRTRWVRAV